MENQIIVKSFSNDFLKTLVAESKSKPKLYDSPLTSQVLLGYSEIDNYLISQVELIPWNYLRDKIGSTKILEELMEENELLKQSHQTNRTIVNPEDKKDKYVLSNTLSEDLVVGAKLPTGTALKKDLGLFYGSYFATDIKKFKFKNLAEPLITAYCYKWNRFTSEFWNLYTREDVIEYYSRKQALMMEIYEMHRQDFGPDLKYLNAVYNKIGDLYFKPMSLDRFYVVMRLIAKNPALAHLTIAHKALDKHKENVKFTVQAKLLAITEHRDRRKKIPEIHRTVNAFLQAQRNDPNFGISLKTVQNFLGIRPVKNFIALTRYQTDVDMNNFSLPYLSRRRCARANMQWQIDTYDAPMACEPFPIKFKETENNKFEIDWDNYKESHVKMGRRVKVCHVVDNMSGLPLGYACSYSENRFLQIAALRMAIYFTKTLPFELLSDNHKGYQTPEWLRIIQLMQSWGCRYRQAELYSPQDKSVVEFTNRNLHSVFREYDGYLGFSPRSISRDSHMSSDYRKASFKYIHVRQFNDVVALIPEIMTKYANHSFAGKPTPNGLFRSSEPIEGRQLDEWKIAKLFYETNSVETVVDSSFNFIHEGKELIYKIYNGKTTLKLEGGSVLCRYNKHDTSTGYLFDKSTDVFLGTAAQTNLTGPIQEDMTEQEQHIMDHHNANNGRSEAYFNQLNEHLEQETEEVLDTTDFEVKDDRLQKPVYSFEAAEEYINTNSLYQEKPKEIEPIIVTKVDKKLLEKRNSEVDLKYDSIKVLEEMEID